MKDIPPPADPDHLVPFLLGKVRVAVPLRHLVPAFWHNTPMEVFPEYFPEYSLRFQFLRPGLRDELSDVMRRCRDRQPQPLHDCDGGIEVSIEEIPLYDSRYSPHLVEKSDRLLLPGQMHGAAFFYQKFVRRAAPFIEMKNKRGEILYGYCGWPGD